MQRLALSAPCAPNRRRHRREHRLITAHTHFLFYCPPPHPPTPLLATANIHQQRFMTEIFQPRRISIIIRRREHRYTYQSAESLTVPFCHLLVFVDEEKKPPLDIDWCIRSACLSKTEEGGREGWRSGGRKKDCFYAL